MGYTKEQREANARKDAEGVNAVRNETVVGGTAPSASVAKKKLPLDTLVTVFNGYNGTLVYKSVRNIGLKIVWEKFGDFDEVELGELLIAKNTQPKFFQKNWFLIEDPEVLEFLRVDKFYENSLSVEDIDDIFYKSEKDIKKIFSNLNGGQKETLKYRAFELIEDGSIDSISVIRTLEDLLGVQLLDK
jgi:hypothetical protein